MVREVERMKTATGLSFRQICRSTVVAYPSLMRWKYRLARKLDPVRLPGPKKLVPPDLVMIRKEVRALRHGRKRTSGTGKLHQCFREMISRRELDEIIRLVRAEVNRERRAEQRRVDWKAPGLIWSMDDSQSVDAAGKFWLHQARDLSSRYTFPPLAGPFSEGTMIAVRLDQLFVKFGAPLVFKRDNGSNLNHMEVNQVFAKHWVLPLNSPPHYPPYNGGIEQAQNEMKLILSQRLAGCRDRQLAAELAAHELNHQHRACLAGRTSCEVLMTREATAAAYDRRKRKEVYDHITASVMLATQEINGTRRVRFDTIWRAAVETWLRMNGLIAVHAEEKVLPCLTEKRSQN